VKIFHQLHDNLLRAVTIVQLVSKLRISLEVSSHTFQHPIQWNWRFVARKWLQNFPEQL